MYSGSKLKQNYFEFNNKIYQQLEGLAMGSPLSNIIAEIFLQHIDTKIQNIIKSFDPNGIFFFNFTFDFYKFLKKIEPH